MQNAIILVSPELNTQPRGVEDTNATFSLEGVVCSRTEGERRSSSRCDQIDASIARFEVSKAARESLRGLSE